MQERETLPRRRLIAPAAVALLIVATAPVIPALRRFFFALSPRRAMTMLAVVLAVLAAGSLAVALTRIRGHRLMRYTGLLVVAGALWLQSAGLSQSPSPSIRAQVNMLERFHIVEYGGLAVLLVFALRPLGLAGSAALAATWATLVGVLDESLQFLVPSRTGEVRDVAINAAAAATGVLFAFCLAPTPPAPTPNPSTQAPPAPRPGRGWPRLFSRSVAVLVLTLGLFVAVAHLGHEIDDPEIGRFLSWHTADGLLAASRERAVRWRVDDPPTGQELCCVQDYYLTEASRHNEHRNERYAAGDLVAAWHADNVLRKYFAPYLEKPLPPNGRLPRDEVDRRALEQAAGERDGASYRSPVLRGRVWTKPGKSVWLAGTLLVSALFWGVSWTMPRSG